MGMRSTLVPRQIYAYDSNEGGIPPNPLADSALPPQRGEYVEVIVGVPGMKDVFDHRMVSAVTIWDRYQIHDGRTYLKRRM